MRSRLLAWMAVAAVLFSVLYYSLFLPWATAATEHYPNADDLAGFIGFFWAATTGLAFLASMFAANRLFGRFGIAPMVVLLPVLYVGSFGVLLVSSAFATLVAVRFVTGVWLQGVASPGWETLTNVVPEARRDQVRTFFNCGPSQAGTAIAGVIAIVGQQALSTRQLAGVGLVAAALTVFATVRIRASYASALVEALRAGRPVVFPDVPVGGVPVAFDRDADALRTVLEAAADERPFGPAARRPAARRRPTTSGRGRSWRARSATRTRRSAPRPSRRSRDRSTGSRCCVRWSRTTTLASPRPPRRRWRGGSTIRPRRAGSVSSPRTPTRRSARRPSSSCGWRRPTWPIRSHPVCSTTRRPAVRAAALQTLASIDTERTLELRDPPARGPEPAGSRGRGRRLRVVGRPRARSAPRGAGPAAGARRRAARPDVARPRRSEAGGPDVRRRSDGGGVARPRAHRGRPSRRGRRRPPARDAPGSRAAERTDRAPGPLARQPRRVRDAVCDRQPGCARRRAGRERARDARGHRRTPAAPAVAPLVGARRRRRHGGRRWTGGGAC